MPGTQEDLGGLWGPGGHSLHLRGRLDTILTYHGHVEMSLVLSDLLSFFKKAENPWHLGGSVG